MKSTRSQRHNTIPGTCTSSGRKALFQRSKKHSLVENFSSLFCCCCTNAVSCLNTHTYTLPQWHATTDFPIIKYSYFFLTYTHTHTARRTNYPQVTQSARYCRALRGQPCTLPATCSSGGRTGGWHDMVGSRASSAPLRLLCSTHPSPPTSTPSCKPPTSHSLPSIFSRG